MKVYGDVAVRGGEFLKYLQKEIPAECQSTRELWKVKPDSTVICESVFLPPVTLDLNEINPPGVIPIRTFAVKPFL